MNYSSASEQTRVSGTRVTLYVCGYNLHGGQCRTHHQIKQLPGWTLTEPQPGHFELTAPAGRTYETHPDTYPT